MRIPSGRKGEWATLGGALAFTGGIEVCAYLLLMYGLHNIWLYNCFLLVQYPLMIWVLRSIADSTPLWFWSRILLPIPTGAWVLECVTKEFSAELFGATAALDSLMLVFLFVTFLMWLSNRTLMPVYLIPEFWVALAFVLFHGMTIPINGLLAYLTEHDVELASRMYVLNDIPFTLYYLLLIGVLGWMVPEQAKAAAHD